MGHADDDNWSSTLHREFSLKKETASDFDWLVVRTWQWKRDLKCIPFLLLSLQRETRTMIMNYQTVQWQYQCKRACFQYSRTRRVVSVDSGWGNIVIERVSCLTRAARLPFFNRFSFIFKWKEFYYFRIKDKRLSSPNARNGGDHDNFICNWWHLIYLSLGWWTITSIYRGGEEGSWNCTRDRGRERV